MSQSTVLVDDHLHQKMKEIAGPKRGELSKEYREAIENHIKYKTQENLKRDSGLEECLNNRITRAEDHLASMLARTGMDTSITLMGVITLLEKLLKVDREIIQNQLRKQGYNYFIAAIKEDKKKKKDK